MTARRGATQMQQAGTKKKKIKCFFSFFESCEKAESLEAVERDCVCACCFCQ